MVREERNGLAGLKHWRYDLPAGLQVALVSLPLSLGVAIASGAPAVTGLVSAVIAGLVFPLIGGSYVTIGGPAAGLAPALLAVFAITVAATLWFTDLLVGIIAGLLAKGLLLVYLVTPSWAPACASICSRWSVGSRRCRRHRR